MKSSRSVRLVAVVRHTTLLLAAVSLAILMGVGTVGAAQQVLRVGASPVPHAEILEVVKPILAKDGIDLRIIEFTDYVLPNLALADGELDANFFQHIPYLETFSADRRLNLTWIAKIHIEPMGIYSRRVKDLKNLANGATVGIPNDPTNGGRALLLVQEAGLIKLKPNVGLAATVFDIAQNPKRLKFRELEAAQLPRALPDVDIAVINTNFALEANLAPLKDAIFMEGSESPYANVLAVRSVDKNKALVKKLAQALQSATVKKFILDKYQGAVVPAF